MVKWAIIGIIVLIVGVGGWWVVRESSKPLPGQAIEQQGRDHVSQDKWEKFKYSSNPPTSGSHDPVWTKPGIYDSQQGDGHLVHSLEHGYVVISYNCDKLSSGQSCDTLKKQLADFAKGNRLWKLIVVPRSSLDVPIALTAWTRLYKLQAFEKQKMSNFIDAFRDHGPEQTME